MTVNGRRYFPEYFWDYLVEYVFLRIVTKLRVPYLCYCTKWYDLIWVESKIRIPTYCN